MNVADICPVGALTTKDFRFKIRVWFLEDVPGVCTGCANGCNIYLGVANNKVYRYVPRRNDAVNDTWICDEGRMSLQARSARPTGSSTRWCAARSACPRLTSVAAAIETAAARLRKLVREQGRRRDRRPRLAARDQRGSLRASGASSTRSAPRRAGVAVSRGRADALLIKAEKAANAAGARALGFGDARRGARAPAQRRRRGADRARPRRARRRLPRRGRARSRSSTR